MKKNHKNLIAFFSTLFLFFCQSISAQWLTPTTVGSRPELVLLYSYQWVTAGKGSQDLKIICKNITTDKIQFRISYEIHFHNGEVEFIPAGSSIVLQPGETLDPKSVADWGGVYKRYFLKPTGGKYGAKERWFKSGKDKYNNDLYSAIYAVMNMEITDFVNISQKGREEIEKLEKRKAEEKQKKEEVQKKKEAEAVKQIEIETTTKKAEQTNIDDFWSDTPSKKSDSQNSSSTKNTTAKPKDPNFFSDSSFQDGLSDINMGDYFKNGKGDYYQRVEGGVKKADKTTYDKAQADKIYAGMEQRENDRKKREVAIDQLTTQATTTFYAMQASNSAHSNMKDAANLSGNFQNLEELNQAFRKQMNAIKQSSQEMRSASQTAMTNYTNSLAANSSSSEGQTYSAAIGVLGGMASQIAANSEEKKARERLKRERDEYEAKIIEKQRLALVGIRNEIDKSFAEGGTPLSSHKITAPVLYFFAYTQDKTNWNKDVNIPLVISNLIPVYRYNDGTYPYTSNVKRSFENAGIVNPKLIGYFTDKTQAENMRRALIDVAPNGKFTLNNIEVKVKEKSTNDVEKKSDDVDFWGTKKTNSETKIESSQKGVDFWGNPIKE